MMEQFYPDPDRQDPISFPDHPHTLHLRGRDLLFGIIIVVLGMVYTNFTTFGGFNLGFAIANSLCILCCTGYLLFTGCKASPYSLTILALCVIISAGFARSDDGFVKFVLCLFQFVGINLGLCLLSGQNLRAPGEFRTLLDGPGVFFRFGFGNAPQSFRAAAGCVRSGGTASKNTVSILIGLAIVVPVLLVVVPLLMSADAAFDGLMKLLPKFDLADILHTVFFGVLFAWILFSMCVGLRHAPKRQVYPPAEKKGLAVLTVNTVLGIICGVYLVYLLSQIAYFSGGFAGILPREYTLAQYARRGFFEMAWICAINLGIIAVSMRVSTKKEDVSLSTRLLCLFIGIVTVFLVSTASAKMFLYIGSYGLTRLRVLTQVIMLFLALSTVMVCIWLFVRKLPYMKTLVIAALVIGAAVIWTDVDTLVARYNVDAYLRGKLETVDVQHLNTLGNGAVPHIARLVQQAPDAKVANAARTVLSNHALSSSEDFRGLNYVNHNIEQYRPVTETTQDEPTALGPLPVDKIYDTYLRDAHVEAFSIAQDHICLRGWHWESDEPLYCLAFPNGDMYEPVHSDKNFLALHDSLGLDCGAHDDWIPTIESEFVTSGSFTGIRGRSIEADITLWYILDMENNIVHGPYRTEDAYWQACYDLKLYPMGHWEETRT